MNQPPECIDCEHCMPDSYGPTSTGICLLDPEFEPYLEEIIELDFKNCHHLVLKKSFDFNCRACSSFSPAESIEMTDFESSMDGFDPRIFNNLSPEEKEIEGFIQKIDFKNLPVERYLKDLYSASRSRRNQAVNTLGSLINNGNEEAMDALLDYLKELGPPKSVEQARFKAETMRHFHGWESSHDLIEMLLSDLEHTVSSNSTRQWINAILNFLNRTPLERIEDRLQSMVDRKVFSYRLKKRVQDILDPEIRDY
ncbi:MAG: hypothetical protein ABR533_11815 [Desulfonatronovibrio sp.]